MKYLISDVLCCLLAHNLLLRGEMWKDWRCLTSKQSQLSISYEAYGPSYNDVLQLLARYHSMMNMQMEWVLIIQPPPPPMPLLWHLCLLSVVTSHHSTQHPIQSRSAFDHLHQRTLLDSDIGHCLYQLAKSANFQYLKYWGNSWSKYGGNTTLIIVCRYTSHATAGLRMYPYAQCLMRYVPPPYHMCMSLC